MIYADNCSTHHAVIVKEKLFDKIHFFYGAPYSPEFNCVENLFSIYKERLKMTKINSENDIIMETVKILKNIE